ncbi:MAG: class I SAM-dependent methyltransferase [Deltaproteobacteria bacterium]|jgi:ubiquinone/menaquinone biosynthesis C-methylase UbiE|nr:class I SAM-dependent methyltransferase [Deltaproteobacteria bacterium]
MGKKNQYEIEKSIITNIDKIEDITSLYRKSSMIDNYENNRFLSFLGIILHSMEIEIIDNTLTYINPHNVVEIAPGTGRLTKNIECSNMGIGIDTSIGMLKEAKKNVKNSKWIFVNGDAFMLPVKSNSVDCLITFRLLRHFTVEDRKRMYQEIHRALNSNSIVIFDMLNKKRGVIGKIVEYTWDRITLYYGLITGRSFEKVYDDYVSLEEIEKELSDCGFKLISSHAVGCFYSFEYILDKITSVRILKHSRILINPLLLPIAIYWDRKYRKTAKYNLEWVVVGQKV